MRSIRLAELLAHKYKIAANTADLELLLRKRIDVLYNYVHGTYSILSECASADASKPNNEEEKKAVDGFKFCKSLVSTIDYLKANRDTINLGDLKKAFLDIQFLIDKNLKVEGDVQFPQISALIWQMIPLYGQKVKPAYIDKVRKEKSNKARTGISRIKSVITDGLKDLHILGGGGENEATSRFTPEKTSLDMYDIIKFIRTRGPEFGIEDNEDWETVFRNDPQFLKDMTTVIYGAERSHEAKEKEAIRSKVLQILKDHRVRTEGVNTPYFEAGEEEARQMVQPEQADPVNEIKTSSPKFELLLRKYQ